MFYDLHKPRSFTIISIIIIMSSSSMRVYDVSDGIFFRITTPV